MDREEKDKIIDTTARNTIFPNGIRDRDWMLYKLKKGYLEWFDCMRAVWDAAIKSVVNDEFQRKE